MYSPDGRYLAAMHGHSVQVVDRSNKVVLEARLGDRNDSVVRFSRDGKLLFTADASADIQRFRLPSGVRDLNLPVPPARVVADRHSSKWVPLAIRATGAEVMYWRQADRSESGRGAVASLPHGTVEQLPLRDWGRKGCIIPGHWLWRLCVGNDHILLTDVIAGTEKRLHANPLKDGDAVMGLSGDGLYLALGVGREAVVVRTGDGVVVRTLTAPSGITSVAVSDDGGRVATGHSDGAIHVYPPIEGTP